MKSEHFVIFRLSFQEVRNQEIIGAGAQHDRKSLVDNTSRHLLAMLAVLARQSAKNVQTR